MAASDTTMAVLRYIRPDRRYYLTSHEFLCRHARQLGILVSMGEVAKGLDRERGGVYYERRRFATNVFGD